MIEFDVVGELCGDPGHLLLMDDDGQCYDYDIALDEIVPIDLDGSWTVDILEEEKLVLVASEDLIAS